MRKIARGARVSPIVSHIAVAPTAPEMLIIPALCILQGGLTPRMLHDKPLAHQVRISNARIHHTKLWRPTECAPQFKGRKCLSRVYVTWETLCFQLTVKPYHRHLATLQIVLQLFWVCLSYTHVTLLCCTRTAKVWSSSEHELVVHHSIRV